jgi:hypothetical protein
MRSADLDLYFSQSFPQFSQPGGSRPSMSSAHRATEDNQASVRDLPVIMFEGHQARNAPVASRAVVSGQGMGVELLLWHGKQQLTVHLLLRFETG